MSGALKRDEWETVRLGDVCEISAGGTPSRTRVEYWKDGTIPWVKISDISGKYLSSTEEKITQLGLDNSPAKIFSKGTILYTIFATIGDVCILNIDAATNQAIVGMTFNERYDKDYVYYLLSSLKEKYEQISRGIAQKNINQSILKNTDIPLPPLDVQRRIAETLDKVSELITLRKTQLEKLDELVKARFVEMFGDPEHNKKGWDIKKLEKLCVVGSSKRIYQNEQSVSGVPFLRISNLVNLIDTGIKESDLYIPRELFLKLKEQGLVPTVGDILITARGTLGKCYIVKVDDEFYFQDGMISWLSKLDKVVNAVYLTQLLSQSGFRKQIDSLQAGSTVAYLSLAQTKKLDIMLPPLDLQKQFVSFVSSVEEAKSPIQQSLDALETLKKSLMQEYFG